MKRLHVHVGVSDLDRSIAFYSRLFATEPTVTKPDYAKWMLDDPRVNFAISSGHAAARGVEHLGIQVEDEAELDEVYGRLQAAERPVLDEGKTICCYAKSEKSWIADPDGLIWEAFQTMAEATVYGAGPGLAAIATAASPVAGEAKCCAPDAAAA
jgi:catechol 2,3-dioxygenase-like lactoylglutathione lyase family enzyme